VDIKFSHQIKMGFRINVHMLNIGHYRNNTLQQQSRCPARGAESRGELHQRGPGAQGFAQNVSGQGTIRSRVLGTDFASTALVPEPISGRRYQYQQNWKQGIHTSSLSY